jgi:formylmethanofuran dehydrogenase subunit E
MTATEETPRVEWSKRAGRCSDCLARYDAQTPVRIVNGRKLCECCAEKYRRNVNGKWVIR